MYIVNTKIKFLTCELNHKYMEYVLWNIVTGHKYFVDL
jgi:hypothetical protein